MLESQVSTNVETSVDKLMTSSEPSQPTPTSTTTSHQASTGRDPDLLPYWNESTKEVSQKLWLPIGIDWPAWELSSSNGSLERLMQNSWFSVTQTVEGNTMVTQNKKLADDLISIVTVFVAKHNGRRSADNRRRRKEEAAASSSKEVQEEEVDEPVDAQEATTGQGQADSCVPHSGGKREAAALDRHGKVDVQRGVFEPSKKKAWRRT
jgi:hypothetical protein